MTSIVPRGVSSSTRSRRRRGGPPSQRRPHFNTVRILEKSSVQSGVLSPVSMRVQRESAASGSSACGSGDAITQSDPDNLHSRRCAAGRSLCINISSPRARWQAFPIRSRVEDSGSKCETSVARAASGDAGSMSNASRVTRCTGMESELNASSTIASNCAFERASDRSRIAQHHATSRATCTQEPEIPIVSRNPFNGRIDLIERPSLEFTRIRRQGSDAQAHCSNIGCVAQLWQSLECLAKRSGPIVVGQWLLLS